MAVPAAGVELNGLLVLDLESTSEQTAAPAAWRKRGLAAMVLGLAVVACLGLSRVSIDQHSHSAMPAALRELAPAPTCGVLSGFQTFCLWTSVVLGTMLGLVASLMAGLGKLLPGHPMYENMSFGFSNVFGPFFGISGSMLQIMTGLAETVGGLCLVIGLWVDALKVYGPCHEGDMVRSLILCDLVSLCFKLFSAMCVHGRIDGSPGTPTGPFVLMIVIIILRIIVCAPWGCFSYEWEMFTFWYCFFIPIPFFLCALMHWTSGAPMYTYTDDNKKFKEMMAK